MATQTDPKSGSNHRHGLTETDKQLAAVTEVMSGLATSVGSLEVRINRVEADVAVANIKILQLEERVDILEEGPPEPPDPVPPTPGPTPNIPAAIDPTGQVDATAQLQAWLRSIPAGGAAVMGNGATYLVNGTVALPGRAPITIDWNGSTWRQTAKSTTRILLIDGGGSGIVLVAPRITGSNPKPGKWDGSTEHNHAIQVGGVQGFTVKGGSLVNVRGDGFYLSGGANKWATNVLIEDCILDGIGRMGVAVTDGVSGLVFRRNTLRNIGYYAMDVEPNGAQVGGRLAGLENGKFTGNTLGPKPYGDYPADQTQADGYAFVTTGASGGGVCVDVEVSGNQMEGDYDFRWNDFLGSTRLVVTNNERQVKH